MSVSGWKTLSDVLEWSRGPPGCPSGRETLPDVRKWLGGPPGCAAEDGWASGFSGVVENPSWMFGSGREALPDVRQ